MLESLASSFAFVAALPLDMTAPFKSGVPMRYAFFVFACIAPVIALALPEDATLSRLLVGTWHGHRHDTQYSSDGTWIMDPPNDGDNSRGKLRIEQGRLSTT